MSGWDESRARVAYFLAIELPPDHCAKINQLLNEAGIQQPFAPHVTVKSQPGLTDPPLWFSGVEATIESERPFMVTLGEPRWFGSEIVYLSVDQPLIVDLHKSILSSLRAAGVTDTFEYDGSGYVPHLTLAAAFAGHSPSQLAKVSEQFMGTTWDPFPVEAVAVYRRLEFSRPYEQWCAISLTSGLHSVPQG